MRPDTSLESIVEPLGYLPSCVPGRICFCNHSVTSSRQGVFLFYPRDIVWSELDQEYGLVVDRGYTILWSHGGKSEYTNSVCRTLGFTKVKGAYSR